jgi:protein-export membrane protein SecD/preprotein translocase SecF subunit
MNKSLLWRGLLILGVTLICGFLVWPPKEKIKLGLDLRGGTHMVLQVKVEDALRSERDKAIERLVAESQSQGTSGLQPQTLSPTVFSVNVPPGTRDKLVEIGEKEFAEWEPQTADGRLTFRLKAEEKARLEDQAVKQALQTIDNRINAFGVAESVTQRQGLAGDRIVVQLPGVDDPERIKKLLKSTAFLEFRIVEGGPANSSEELLAAYSGSLPPTLEILEGPVKDETTGKVIGTQFYVVQKTAKVTGRDLKDARPDLGEFNDPIVSFTFSHEGGQRFGELTASSVGKPLAIVLDGRVMSAPRIESRITDRGIIRGQFTQEEVDDLSMVLRTGALPAGIVILEEHTVGPSLGQDSIRDGMRAGLVGSALVVLIMLGMYHLAGLNAILALTLNVLITFAGLVYFDAALTLPGIAGIVLTIGMAVDANVLIFERIREELRAGRTVRSAVDEGFKRAFSAIIDTHLTTLIAALFLFQFGTGPIRGFAVTLGIGLTASLFTAVFVSRWLFDLVLSRPGRAADKLSIGKTIQLFQDRHYQFMKYRRQWALAAVIGSLLGVSVFFLRDRLNVGIEFAGGTQVIVEFRQPPQADELRKSLATAGFADATIQRYGGADSGQYMIRTRLRDTGEEGHGQEIVAALDRIYNPGKGPRVDLNLGSPENIGAALLQADPLQLRGSDATAAQREYEEVAERVVVARTRSGLFRDWSEVAKVPEVGAETVSALQQRAVLGNLARMGQEVVGPTIGAELRERGFWAVSLSMLAMMAFIWVRYELRFGIGAVIAIFHTVLVVLGLYALLDFEFNLTTVAAFLTLVGYQVNDSVVVFDRIRETLRRTRSRGSFEQLVNEAVNQTLSRTLLTGGTVLAVLAAMLLLGGEVLRGFSFVMFAGIIVGTYASIWVAASFSLLWEDLLQRRRSRRGPPPPPVTKGQGKPREATRLRESKPNEPKAAAGGRRR